MKKEGPLHSCAVVPPRFSMRGSLQSGSYPRLLTSLPLNVRLHFGASEPGPPGLDPRLCFQARRPP